MRAHSHTMTSPLISFNSLVLLTLLASTSLSSAQGTTRPRSRASRLATGAIVGVAIGGVVLLLLLLLCCCLCFRKRRQRQRGGTLAGPGGRAPMGATQPGMAQRQRPGMFGNMFGRGRAGNEYDNYGGVCYSL
jgi:hypothetical protein